VAAGYSLVAAGLLRRPPILNATALAGFRRQK
jgi:hypothetical protein